MATIAGTAADDTLSGTAADDTLTGLAGADRIDGGDGNDVIASDQIGSGGGSTPTSIDPRADLDTLLGGGGNDVILAGYGDTVDGGPGTNLLSIDLAGAATGANFQFLTFNDGPRPTTINGSGNVL